MIRHELLHLVNEYQKREGEQKDLSDLIELIPEELQKIKLNLNKHELMEQIHYRLKERIISYSIAKQKDRRREKMEIETAITTLNESLNTDNIFVGLMLMEIPKSKIRTFRVMALFSLCCS